MVILVEDDNDTRESIGEFLKSIYVEYIAVGDVKEATRLLDLICPAILLTDFKLNGDTADVLIKQCAKRHPKCKSILITAANPNDVKLHLSDVELDHVLYKPFDLDELEKVLVPFINNTV